MPGCDVLARHASAMPARFDEGGPAMAENAASRAAAIQGALCASNATC